MIYFSDAILRVFSTDPKRQASADVMETYEAELARSEIRSPDASDMDDFYNSILPSLEAYLNPGMSNKQSIFLCLALLFGIDCCYIVYRFLTNVKSTGCQFMLRNSAEFLIKPA